jgi:hypothetical protein
MCFAFAGTVRPLASIVTRDPLGFVSIVGTPEGVDAIP